MKNERGQLIRSCTYKSTMLSRIFMDIFEFVTVLIIVLAGVVLVNRALTLADARIRLRLEIERKRATLNAATAEIRARQRAINRGDREPISEPQYDEDPRVPQL